MGAGGGELLFEVFGAVVEAGVEAEFFDDVATFKTSNLADGRPDGSAGGGDDDGSAGLGLADIEEAPCRR